MIIYGFMSWPFVNCSCWFMRVANGWRL